MKKYIKLTALTFALCMAMSFIIPNPTIKADSSTEETETTTSDCAPFSNKEVPPIQI